MSSIVRPSRSRLLQLITAMLPYAALILIFVGMGVRDLIRESHVNSDGVHDTPAIFCTQQNLSSLARECAPIIVAAAGMTLVILTGGIDLSAGSIMGVSSAVACLAANRFQNPALGMLCGVGAGLLCGVLNGTLVIGLRVQSFIVTLGMLMSLRGITRLLNKNSSVYIGDGIIDKATSSALLANFKWLSGNIPGVGVPWFLLVAIAAVVVLGIVLNYTRLGRRLYAVGSNEEAARLSGVRVGPTKLVAYAIAGMTAGMAGVMNATRLGGSTPQTGESKELTIIAAVVIGGTSLLGGQGTIAGCVLGTVLMQALSSACTSLRLDDSYQMVIIGLFLVGAAAIDLLRHEKAS
ncbi:MAG: ABC transporter permease [Planctomycetota bacterium]